MDDPQVGLGSTPVGGLFTASLLAVIKRHRKKSAHTFDPINGSTRHRAIAIVFGERDKEISLATVAGEAEIRGKIVVRRDRRPTHGDRELTLLEIWTIAACR